jgi:hypothetical protein
LDVRADLVDQGGFAMRLDTDTVAFDQDHGVKVSVKAEFRQGEWNARLGLLLPASVERRQERRFVRSLLFGEKKLGARALFHRSRTPTVNTATATPI